VDNTVVTISNEDDMKMDLMISGVGESILVKSEKGYYDNGFYNINISDRLTSKGGNRLNEAVNYPFYVPFH